MTSVGKLMLTSKKPWERRSEIAPRKPAKNCYCCFEVNKAHLKSSRVQCKPASVRETDDKESLVSPISCETFRRVRKIDYTPRSQFLRNVQNKIHKLQTEGQRDCLPECPRSSNYHRFMASARIQDAAPDKKMTLADKRKRTNESQESLVVPTAPANSITSNQNKSDRDHVVCVSSKARASLQGQSKLRKTLSSKREMSESNEGTSSKLSVQSKRVTQWRKQNCHCCSTNELENTTRLAKDKWREKRDLPEYREQRDRCPRHKDAVDDPVDQEIEDLRKFRDQNYFETHGSSHTLASSGSSGSLQQYLLNERLFPEPVRRIHKRDLMVTMPSCATVQRKRIHYFPRNVVQQERNVYNTNYRRKRYQSCPLTGHAIDLGVLKIRPPLNSLALKYQKRAS